jgi:signal transduction histidine kinase
VGKGLRLSARLFLSFLAPTALALGALAVLADDVAQRSFERQRSARLIDIGLAVRSRFTGNYYADPQLWSQRLSADSERMIDGLRQRVEPIWQETGARRILLFSPAQTSFYDTRPDIQFGQPLYELALDGAELREVLRTRQPKAGVLYCAPDVEASAKSPPSFWGCGEGESAYQSAFVPVVGSDGEVVALIGVEGSAEDLNALRTLRRNLAWLFVGVIAAIAVTSALTSRRLIAPVRRLVGEARRIGQGDLRHPIPRTRADELGDLEASLDDMRQALSDRDQQMQMMLSGVAHEVRNPLGGIKLFLGLLDEDLAAMRHAPASDTRQHVAKIQRELDYLDRVVSEFLEFARRGSALNLERLSGQALLDDVAQVMRADLMGRGVSVRVQVEPPDIEVTADRDRLRRVLINLVRNAAQASPNGAAVTLRLDAPPARPTDRRLQVIDQGSGIAPKDLDRVFQPFFTTREKGTGLGLALTRKVLEDHDGVAAITSALGEGTTVTLTWPFREDLPKPQMVIPEGWLG